MLKKGLNYIQLQLKKIVILAFFFFSILFLKQCLVPDALHKLAILYQRGIEGEVKKDVKKAMELFERGVKINHCKSIYSLAHYYENDREENEIKMDIKKSIFYYELAIKNFEDPFSMNNLALIYFEGFPDFGVKKDIKKAVELWSRASLLNHPSSTFNLALIYEDGKVVPRDLEKSASLYFKVFQSSNKERDVLSNFLSIVSHNKVCWKKRYHPHYPFSNKPFLDSQIVTLFLLSKFRKLSSVKFVSDFLIKGITKIILKFLCTINQKIIKNDD